MRKYLIAFMALIMGLSLSAQEAQAPQSGETFKPDPEVRLITIEEQLERYDSRIRTLEGRIRMSGYLAVSSIFDLDKFQLDTYDQSPENTRFRFNFDYTSGDFGLRARLQYR